AVPAAATINAVPAVPATPTVVVTQPTCSVPTGDLGITIIAGEEYSFDGGATWVTSASNPGLASGAYSIDARLTSDNTCIALVPAAATINAVPAVPATPTVVVTQPTCSVPTGDLGITIIAGEEYSFDGGATWVTSASNPGLAPGAYNIDARLTADNTCIALVPAAATINAVPAVPATPTVVVTQPTCSVPTGDLGITIIAGEEYSFDGGATWVTSASNPGLAPGAYNIDARLTADNTCIALVPAAATINAVPAVPATPTVVVTQPTCSVPTGDLGITIIAGEEYSFDGGATWVTSASNPGLAPGAYSIDARLTSDNTCIAAVPAAATINAVPATPATPTVVVTQPTCSVPTGDLGITIIAGEEYSFDGGATWVTSASNPGLAPGAYSIDARLTSDNTCIALVPAAATINAVPAVPATPTVVVTQPTCSVPTGDLGITIIAGEEYSFDGGATWVTSASNPGLAPGAYNIDARLTADNTCIALTPAAATINAVPAV